MVNTNPELVIKHLTEKNYRQASDLMLKDLEIKQLKDQVMKQEQEEIDIKDNVIDLNAAKLKLASKEPPRKGNWLSELTKGTRFLASKGSGEDLTDYMVGTDPKAMPAVYLGYNLAGRDGGFKFVDPIKFCNNWNFHSIIRTDIFKEEVDAANGNGIEVRTGTVEGDGERQVLPPLHEE